MSNYKTSLSYPPTANVSLMRGAIHSGMGHMRHRAHDATMEWFALADRIGQHVDLDATAYATGAMVRRRGVPSATNLLCLALLYGPGRTSLRLIAERSAALGISHASEPALLRCLLKAVQWLELLAGVMISDRLDERADASRDTVHMLSKTPHERRQRQVAGAKSFLIDFQPWPDALYNDDQIQWLMSCRWLFVTAVIEDGPPNRTEMNGKPASALGHSRQMAHLVAALASPEH